MSAPLPQPADIPVTDKEDAMGAYLMVFGALHLGLPLPFIGLIASWIYHGINAKKAPFVGFHTYQSLLFSIPSSLISAAWIVWVIVVIVEVFQRPAVALNLTAFWVFTVFSVLVYLVYVVYCIVGAVQARKGRLVYFPVFGRMAFYRYFSSDRPVKPAPVNEPPKGV